MSVTDKEQVDGVAYDSAEEALVLLLTDHLGWENEYEHLSILQEKINNYISYCETKQYLEIFKGERINMAVIDIQFLNEPTKNAMDFLQVVQDTVGPLGIKIRCTIAGGMMTKDGIG